MPYRERIDSYGTGAAQADARVLQEDSVPLQAHSPFRLVFRSSLLQVCVVCVLFLMGLMLSSCQDPGLPPNLEVPLSDDGSWCWFQDERAIVAGDYLIVGSVSSGWKNAEQRGDVIALVYNLRQEEPVKRVVLHPRFLNVRERYDDHNAPAFVAMDDGSVLAVYAMHGDENAFYAKRFRPSDPQPRAEGVQVVPSESSKITYSNVFRMLNENDGKGRLYNFFRGLNDSFKPSYSWSDDGGKTWQTGFVFIDVPSTERHRPYAKYVSNGRDTIHIVYTEGHPRDFDNSVYHVFYRNGVLHQSDGTVIRELREGLRSPLEGTKVFAGDAANVAWTSDIHLDEEGRPHLVFSVQRDGAGKPEEDHGLDLRYYYAWWDGTQWYHSEIGHAGTRLYQREADYTGNIALDPQDLNTVYFSSNADPATGEALISSADGKRHWELFRGVTQDRGQTWTFTPLTRNSTTDQLRPMVPVWPKSGQTALLWLRGEYRTYTDFQQAVMLRLISK
jgi:hypothetical protein